MTVLAGLALGWVWPVGAEHLLPAPLRYGLGGGVIAFAVNFLGFRSVRAMRRSGQSENPYRTTTEILQTGPFAITRNPMYLQMVLVCFGFAVLLGNLWILLLTPFCAILLQVLVIYPEERYLERKFGDAYLDYKRRVRRWI
ncbi:methyltransferase family protein [Sulfitobacter aestuarii]|uniref:Methyltransferase family protein n=1 Tax=Sulfitobacter aestuarii TaxID=2161676 RepID=A0ABW5U245_9RHOB